MLVEETTLIASSAIECYPLAHAAGGIPRSRTRPARDKFHRRLQTRPILYWKILYGSFRAQFISDKNIHERENAPMELISIRHALVFTSPTIYKTINGRNESQQRLEWSASNNAVPIRASQPLHCLAISCARV